MTPAEANNDVGKLANFLQKVIKEQAAEIQNYKKALSDCTCYAEEQAKLLNSRTTERDCAIKQLATERLESDMAIAKLKAFKEDAIKSFEQLGEERTKLVTKLDICRGSLNDAVRQLEEKDKELEAANDVIAVMNKELFYYQNSR